ncbi:multiprotein-bridging factor 1 family protein [Flavobacterium sp.]|jgi:ribosome-binding protein aMBF1 (putative translation factor)|uniref:multiprotein-bridging factor 1 family protein n=1 Tax=Flavobacterium sp. TaxID=239 RepID=UPI0037BE39C0
MNNKPRTYKSPILSELIENISQEELEKTESKMRLAVKIADAIKAKGYGKTEFAKKIKKNNSEISKWLSGTHNFTHDTLILLQKELDVNLVNSVINEKIEIKNIHIVAQSSNSSNNNFNLSRIFNFKKNVYVNTYSLSTI